MIEHIHPTSGATIRGMLLPPMTELLPGDRYDSTSGSWEEQHILAGCAIDLGCETLWIRPSGDLATLSEEGKDLLRYLADHNLLLTEDLWHWKIIPSLHWKDDGRMDWGVKHPDCIPNLIARGFLLPHPSDPEVYEVTEAGREAARMMLQ
jgi:hypothetical protein